MNFAENVNENFYKVNNLMLINAHLNGFHWAKSDIGEKFSRGWGDEVERCSVKIRIFLSHRIRVNVLENFVKAEFASSLHGVANQGRGPAASKRLDTTVSDGNLKWSIFLFNNLQVFNLPSFPCRGKDIWQRRPACGIWRDRVGRRLCGSIRRKGLLRSCI